MTLPIQAEYITEDKLDQALGKVRQQIDDLSRDLNDKIDALLARNQEALEQEKREREQAIEKLQQQSDQAAQRTAQRLEEIDDKLDGISRKVEHINGGLAGWTQAMESAKTLHQQNSGAIEKADLRLDTLTGTVNDLSDKYTAQEMRLAQTHKTIHGDSDADGPDSLFAEIRKLQIMLEANASAQHKMIADTREQVSNNATDIALIKEDNARLRGWLTMLGDTAKAIWGNKLVLGLLLTLLTTLIFGAIPELRDIALSALQSLLSET